MSRLYVYANILYEMSLYLLIWGSWFAWADFTLFLLTAALIISALITGAPSTYHLLGYAISSKKTNREGYDKLLQFILLFGLIPIVNEVIIPFFILGIFLLSLLGLSRRLAIYRQLDQEDISILDFFSKIQQDTTEMPEFEDLLQAAWRTIWPFFLLGLSEAGNVFTTTIVFTCIIFFQGLILRNLYSRLWLVSSNPKLPSDFVGLATKGSLILLLLLLINGLHPGSFLSYVVSGLYTQQVVGFIHRERYLKHEQT